MGKSTIPSLPALVELGISCQHSDFCDGIHKNYSLALQMKRKMLEGDKVTAEITYI